MIKPCKLWLMWFLPFFYYFIVINIILVDVFHDVTKNEKTKQLCYKKDIKIILL